MNRRVCLVTVVVALVLPIGVGLFLQGGPLVSRPDTIRQTYYDTPPFNDWEATFYPTAGKPWVGRVIKPSDLKIDSTDRHVRVTALSALFVTNYAYATFEDSWKPRPPVVIHAFKGTQQVTLPGGETLGIDEVFTAYPTGPGATEWVSDSFDPLTLKPFQPMPGKESPAIKPDRGGCHFFPQQEYPEMAFAVSGDLTHELAFRLFDTKTHHPMKELMGAGGNLFTMPLQQWHSSTFRCVIDLVTGPAEERKCIFRMGASASFPEFDLEVILVEKLQHPIVDQQWLEINSQTIIPAFSGPASVVSSPPQSPPQRCYTWTLDPAETIEESLVALSLSNIQWLPPSIELEALTKSGTLIEETVRCGGNLVFASLPAAPEELRSLRVRYPSTWVRVVFEFDHIPGLPKDNYGLSNLFDAYIPYSKSNYRPERFISNCTKLKLRNLHKTIAGPTSFEYENTTVHEITQTYQAEAGIFGLKVDDGQRLEGIPSPKRWLKGIWSILRKKF